MKNSKVAEAIAKFKNSDPSRIDFFDKAYGYAVFPTVAKGGFGTGGAYGEGKVFKKEKLIGYLSVTQVTIGFKLGGQAYSEIIFFKDKKTLDDFKGGNFEFGAQASAVAATVGVSADAGYDNGVAIFIIAKGGLMYEDPLVVKSLALTLNKHCYNDLRYKSSAFYSSCFIFFFSSFNIFNASMGDVLLMSIFSNSCSSKSFCFSLKSWS